MTVWIIPGPAVGLMGALMSSFMRGIAARIAGM